MRKLYEILQQLWQRINWQPNVCTWLELLLIMAVIPVMLRADPAWFVEDGLVENIQLIVLSLAFIVALKSQNQHRFFVFLGMIILFMIMRETNLFRGYFCEKYLSPYDICRWKEFKYGYLVTGGRLIFVAFVLWYFIKNKLWRPLWNYIVKAPIYIWDFTFLVLMILGGTIAEFSCIDNEIMEEFCELISYIVIGNCIWRYRQVSV